MKTATAILYKGSKIKKYEKSKMVRCSAMTAQGTQCLLNCREGATTCGIHNPFRNRYFSEETLNDVTSNQRLRILRGLRELNKIQNETHLQDFLASNIIGRVISLLLESEDIHIINDAAWVLTNVAAVPGIIGAQAIWHHLPDMTERCRNFLFLRPPEETSLFMECLANIAGSGREFSATMINNYFHVLCTRHLKTVRLSANIRKNAGFLLSNLATHMDLHTAEEVLEEIAEIPPILLTDSRINVEILWVIHKLFGICQTLKNIHPTFIISNTCIQNNKVSSAALHIIGDVVAGDNTLLINRFLTCGLVKSLHKMLLKSLEVKQVIWILSNLALEDLGNKMIIETPGLLFDLLSKIRYNDDVYWVLANLACKGDIETIGALQHTGSGLFLLNGLRSAHQTSVKICLEGLLNLLHKGGYVIFSSLQNNGLRDRLASLDEVHSELKNNLLLAIEGFHQNPAEPNVNPEEIPFAVEPTNAGRIAAVRLSTELARGTGGAGAANVADLVFTANDVVYLNRLGYAFRAGGKLFSVR